MAEYHFEFISCRYAIWDDNGILLFRSSSLGTVPTAVAWRPQGDSFLVGTHNQIVLCDAAGWQAAQQSHTSGGAHAMAWAPGGMMCGIATGSGAVLLSNILDLDLQNGSIQACQHLSTVGLSTGDCRSHGTTVHALGSALQPCTYREVSDDSLHLLLCIDSGV